MRLPGELRDKEKCAPKKKKEEEVGGWMLVESEGVERLTKREKKETGVKFVRGLGRERGGAAVWGKTPDLKIKVVSGGVGVGGGAELQPVIVNRE